MKVTPALKKYFSEIGRKGGKAKSDAKNRAQSKRATDKWIKYRLKKAIELSNSLENSHMPSK